MAFWVVQFLKIVYFRFSALECLRLLHIFEDFVLLLLLEQKVSCGLLLDTDFDGVPWRVLYKLSLTWFTGPHGLLLRIILSVRPFVFRLVPSPLRLLLSLVQSVLSSEVKVMKLKLEKVDGKCLKKIEFKAIKYSALKGLDKSQKAKVGICEDLVYVVLCVSHVTLCSSLYYGKGGFLPSYA